MDAAEFEKRARNPALTREQLETLKANALERGNIEFAAIANEVLLESFPATGKRGGGATPTTVLFRGKEEHFSSGKEAYLWLVEKFRDHRPGLLDNQDKWHARAFKGVTRKYFARSHTDLFPKKAKQSEDGSSFSKLVNGWYANVNLSHDQKFQILLRLAAICQLSYPEDWDFRVTGASTALVDRKEAVLFAKRLLDELANL